MGLLQVVRAEMRFVYADILRRKGVLAILIAWPYMLTAFVVIVGSSMGSPQLFAQRVGVDPVPFFIVSSFVLLSTLSVIDDIMWKPIHDELMGTLPYILSSPVNRVLYYASLPIPRLLLAVLIGSTSLVPVLTLYWGLHGFELSLAIAALGIVSALLFTPTAIVIAMALYVAGGESWRLINIVRPILMILIGAFYPRWLMPLAGYVLSSLLPPSHCVEVIQRLLTATARVSTVLTLMGIATALAMAYLPASARSVAAWERKKLVEGVRL